MMKDYKNVGTFEELIEIEHGKIGTDSRNSYEQGAQVYRERNAQRGTQGGQYDSRAIGGQSRD